MKTVDLVAAVQFLGELYGIRHPDPFLIIAELQEKRARGMEERERRESSRNTALVARVAELEKQLAETRALIPPVVPPAPKPKLLRRRRKPSPFVDRIFTAGLVHALLEDRAYELAKLGRSLDA